jgi:O-methyltransferase
VRQETILRLASTIEETGVEGAIVECGVLDGGTAALMAYGTRRSGRAVHLFDSWEGLPESTGIDGDAGAWAGEVVGSPRRVANIMRQLGVRPERLHLHKGWFSDTFPRANINKIALLHIDCDFYESVKLTLKAWGPRLTSGGFIQIDDYETFIGCTTATNEYLSANPQLRLERMGETYAKAFVIRIP